MLKILFNELKHPHGTEKPRVTALTLSQEERVMFSQGGLQNGPGQEHSLWTELCIGARTLPDVEQPSLWSCGSLLNCRAADVPKHYYYSLNLALN